MTQVSRSPAADAEHIEQAFETDSKTYHTSGLNADTASDSGYDDDGIKLVVGEDVDFQFGGSETTPSSKKKKKKKKKKSKNGQADVTNMSNLSLDPYSGNTDNVKTKSRKDKDSIWDISREEEIQRLREFWNSLDEEERRQMIQDEKASAFKRIRDHEKRSCSCSVCVRKREAIEEELDYLYGRYFRQLDKVPTISIRSSPHCPQAQEPSPPPNSNGRPVSPVQSVDIDGFEDEDDYDNSTPHDLYHHDHSKQREIDLFDFRALSGGFLSVADDLLQNQGKRFITMMEKLAEERIARDEEEMVERRVNAFYENAPDDLKNTDKPEDNGSASGSDNDGIGDGNIGDTEENGDDIDEEYSVELYDDEPQEYYDEEYLDDEDEDCEDDEPLSKEERILENREVLQYYAAQLFEQRVLTAYRESIARERQKKLLEELEEEKRLEEEKEKKRLLDKEKKRDKKRLQKLAKEEEKAKKEAEKREQEEALRIEREKKNEEARLRKLELKQKKDAEKKKRDEEDRKRRLEDEKRKEQKRRQEEENRIQNEEARKLKQMKRQLEEERRIAEENAKKLELQLDEEREGKRKQEDAAAAAASLALKKQQEKQERIFKQNNVATARSPIPSPMRPSYNASPLIGSSQGQGQGQGQAHMNVNALNSSANYVPAPVGMPSFGQSPLSMPLDSRHSTPFRPLQPAPPTGAGIPTSFTLPTSNSSPKSAALRDNLEEDDNPIDELNRMMSKNLRMDMSMDLESFPKPATAPVTAPTHAPSPSPASSIPPSDGGSSYPNTALQNFSPLFGTRNVLGTDSLWSSNSSLWGSVGTSAAQRDENIRRYAISAYQQLVQEGWSSSDGYVSTLVLYQKTMKLMGGVSDLSQTEFHKACGVFDTIYSDRFESLRDSIGIITHLKYSPQGQKVTSQGMHWPMLQGVL